MGRHSNSSGNRPGTRNHYDVRIDLHGMYSAEAMSLVERTIRCNPGASILIIHGNGSGKLRSAVRGALQAHRFPAVRTFVFGEDIYAPGLDGATVVYT